MAAPVDASVLTEQEHAALATRRLCEVLGLGTLKPKELKHLSVALSEVATEEASRHSEFGERIVQVFHSLAQPTASKPVAKKEKTRSTRPQLVAIGYVDPALLGPDKPLNPYLLQQIFGDAQLRLALEGRSLVALKQAVAIVQERHPGTSPANRTQKAALIDYIVGHIVG